jgi:FkbM family methyltransferase
MQIGAHVGDVPNDCLFKQDLSDKNIVLIEPIPYLFKKLVENYQTKNVKNIVCLNLAVSNVDSQMKLYAPSEVNDFTKFHWCANQLASVNSEHIHAHQSNKGNLSK